jgi:hypothetical protein
MGVYPVATAAAAHQNCKLKVHTLSKYIAPTYTYYNDEPTTQFLPLFENSPPTHPKKN